MVYPWRGGRNMDGGRRLAAGAAVAAVTAYQDDMLAAILPMYLPMVLAIGIHFAMLLAGKTRYPRWMLAFHPVTWNILLVVIPDIAQAMGAPAATWMSVMSQSSTNSAIVLWCAAAAVYGEKNRRRRAGAPLSDEKTRNFNKKAASARAMPICRHWGLRAGTGFPRL